MADIKRSTDVSLLLLSVIATGVVLYVLRELLIPLALASFLAVLFRPITDLVRRLRMPSFVGLIVVLAISSAALWGMSAIINVGIDSAVEKAPVYAEKAQRLVDNVHGLLTQFAMSDDLLRPIQDAITPQSLLSLASTGLGSFLNIMADGVLVLLYLVFIILGSGKFHGKLTAAMALDGTEYLAHVYDAVNVKVLKYLRTKTLFNVLTALSTYAVLVAFEVDFAPVIAMLAFFFTYLPNIGSFITVFLTGIVSLVQFENPGLALVIVVILIVVSNLIGNVLEPKAMGMSLNLSPLVVLISMVFWGWMWGIVGMILSVPIMAVIKVVMEQFPATQPLAILLGNKAPTPANS